MSMNRETLNYLTPTMPQDEKDDELEDYRWKNPVVKK